MLTADLLRVTVRQGMVKPTYLRGKHARAEAYAVALCALYEKAQGWSRAALAAELQEIVGDAHDFLLARGLAKLLDDRCEWSSEAAVPADELRAALYDEAFARGVLQEGALKEQRPPRDAVIEKVAARFQLSATQVEQTMFADLRDAEILESYKAIAPDALLRRYDVALAQATLLRATSLQLTVSAARPAQLRALLHALKFYQLLFQLRRTEDGAWLLEIDGPVSILQRSTRYGLQLAMLVPTLLHLEGWTLEAELRWPHRDEPLRFELSPKDKLEVTGRLRGDWVSAEQQLLEERLASHKSGWRVDPAPRLIPLGARDLFAPDLTLVHPDGRRAYVEIVGTWRISWLRRRLAVLREHGPPNTVLCVSRSMAAEKEALADFSGEIVEFAQVISLPKLLQAIEAVAHPEEAVLADLGVGLEAAPKSTKL